MDVPIASFWLVDEATRTLEARAVSGELAEVAFPTRTLTFEGSAVGWVAQHRERLHVPEVFADARIAGYEWWRRRGVRSFLGVPVLSEAAVVAVLVLSAPEPFALGRDEHELLASFVAQAAVAIRNARLYEASERPRRRAGRRASSSPM